MKKTVTFAILAVVSLICSHLLNGNIQGFQRLYDAIERSLPGAKIEYEIDAKLAIAIREDEDKTPGWRTLVYELESELMEAGETIRQAEWILAKHRYKKAFRAISFLAFLGFSLGALHTGTLQARQSFSERVESDPKFPM